MPISTDGLDGYQIEAPIGRGGFATVFRAADNAHGRRVAIKVLNGVLNADEQRRFDRERLAIGQLADHPNVVPVYESGITAEGEAYLVLEHASGGSLANRLERGPLPWGEAVEIITAVASAVSAAHAVGIRHRDIKPDNILLSQYGVPKLSDFGIASVSSGATTTSSATMTVAHSPPEMLQGVEPTDAVDIYSLASTFHHLVTGAPPFFRAGDANVGALITRVLTEAPPDLVPAGVPPAVAAVILEGMAKQPGERQPTAAAFASDLREAAGMAPAAPAVEPGLMTAAIDREALGIEIPSQPSGLTPKPATTGEPLAAAQPTVPPIPTAPGSDQATTVSAPTPPAADRQPTARPDGLVHPNGSPPIAHPVGPPPTAGQTPPTSGGRRRAPIFAAVAALGLVVVGGVGALVLRDDDTSPGAGPDTTGATDDDSSTGPDGEPTSSSDQTNASDPASNDPASNDPEPDLAPIVIEVGETPQQPVAIGTDVWVANIDSDTISIIDAERRVVSRTINVGSRPTSPVEAGGFVWVANQGDNTVFKLDPASGEIVATVSVGAEPDTPAVVGNELWVPNLAGATLTRIDLTTGDAVGNVAVGQYPSQPIEGRESVWVSNQWDGTVSQIDGATGVVSGTIETGALPQRPVSVNGALYVANTDDDLITRINETTLEVTEIPTGPGSKPLAPLWDGDELWFPLSGTGQLARFDVTTNSISSTVNVDAEPLTPFFDGATLWVAHQTGSSVKQIDATSGALLRTEALEFAPGHPVQIGSAVWVSGLFDSRIVVIDYALAPGASVPTTVPGGVGSDPNSDQTDATVTGDRGATGPFDREEQIQQLMAGGLVDRETAECIIDTLVEELGEEPLLPGVQMTPEEESVVTAVTFNCALNDLDLG